MKQIKTRIGLKYDTYAHWTARGTWDQTNGTFTPDSNAPAGYTYDAGFKPLKGEVIFYEIPTTNPNSDVTVAGIDKAQTPPAILFKVGDGVNFLKDLPWGSAIAADVYAWAKQQSLLGGVYNDQTGTWTFPTQGIDPSVTNSRNEIKAYIDSSSVDLQVQIISTGNPNEFQLQTSTDGGTTWVDAGQPFSFTQVTYTGGSGINVTGTVISVKPKTGGYIQNTSTTDTTDPENPVVTDTGIDVVTTTVTYTAAQDAQGNDPATPANLTATGNGVVTNQAIGQIKSYVDAKAGESVVTVEKQSTAEDDFAATYVVKQNGQQVGVKINIPKDFLVKSASLAEVSTANTPYAGAQVGDKYIDFVINTKADGDGTAETDSHVYLPVKDLVDVYTGNYDSTAGAGSTTYVTIEVNSNNQISAHTYTVSLNSLGNRQYTFFKYVVDGNNQDISVPTDTGVFTLTDSAGHGTIQSLPTGINETSLSGGSIANFNSGNYVITAENLYPGALFKLDGSGADVACKIVGVSYASDGLATAGDVKDYVDSHIAAATQNIEAGDAIAITTVGSTKTVAVKLSESGTTPTPSGLDETDGLKVKLDDSRNGLNIQGNTGSGLSITQNGLAIDDSLTFYLNCGGADPDLGVIVTSQSGQGDT